MSQTATATIGHNNPPHWYSKVPFSAILSMLTILAGLAFGYGKLSQEVSTVSEAVKQNRSDIREIRDSVIEQKTNQRAILDGIKDLQRQRSLQIAPPPNK